MRISVVVLTAFVLSSGSVQAAPTFVDKYRVRVVAGFYSGLHESLALREVAYSGGSFWMAERRRRVTAGITGPTVRIERQWIDGRQCPALAGVVGHIAVISTSKARTTPAPFHGAHVYLGELSADGGYTVRADYEGAVATWWKGAEEELKSCWSNTSFTVDDALLPLTLEGDADEEPYRALEHAR